ncbi:MAG: LapA family protein [Burkholderiales bacterium]|uniref:LapA family protein n=1 Tax=Inhella sp. TaxID=1921806 RepID=UPI001AC891B1|nr:LapA family protein [Burkholderiales bacterium]
MPLFTWLLRLFLFFTLFAFALNNSHDVVVHWFFGFQWRTPLVIVVLLTFALGAAFGIVAMVPAWWRQRRQAATPLPAAPPQEPPRDGL